MKRICISSVLSLMLLLLGGIVTQGFAQSKTDAVIMLNGERKEGKVVGIQSNTIKVKYTGEQLEYELQKEDIRKIQFAIGRVEVINEAPQSAASGSSQPSCSKPDGPQKQNSGVAFRVCDQ